jgi:uncharacterized protein YllA (UPF0747 family)
MLEESGGEITPNVEVMLAVLNEQLPAKLDNYAAIIERFEMFSTYHKAKAAQQAQLSKQCQAVADRMQANIKAAMIQMGKDEVSGNDVKYRLVKSNPSCVIDQEDLISANYKTIVQETKIDKKRILEDMKLGVPVEGAHLEQGLSLRQYANSPSKGSK